MYPRNDFVFWVSRENHGPRSKHTTPLPQTPIKVKYKYNYLNYLPPPQTCVDLELV